MDSAQRGDQCGRIERTTGGLRELTRMNKPSYISPYSALLAHCHEDRGHHRELMD
jgi:hypothetical protein